MKIVQANQFKKGIKKLHPNQKRDVDVAVRAMVKDPDLSHPKIGDLAGVLVYKFKMVNQLTLLEYTYHHLTITLTLLALGTQENFYRDMKKSL